MNGGSKKRTAPAACSMPPDHLDLLDRPLVAALATLLPGGRPQTQPIWYSYDPPRVLINTMRGFRKERNLRLDSRATLLVIDPHNSSRWLEMRGTVELRADGARAHLDHLARLYAGVDRYFGGCVSAELSEHEIPVLGRLTPIRVVDETSADRVAATRASARPALRRAGPRIELPESHRDLLDRPLIAVLSTLMLGGQPQTQPVWFDLDGHDLQINTTRERQKGRNLERDPRATLLIVDPADSSRWIEIRADVEVTEQGAVEHLDRLTRRYTPWPRYYGYIHQSQRRHRETRIVCRLLPRHVVCDAIHRPVAAGATNRSGTEPLRTGGAS